MNVKTKTLLANTEQKINLEGGTHFKIKNISDTTIYISQKSPVTPKSDGVKSIQPNTEDILTDVAIYSIQNGMGNYRGTIYALATENCTIELEATNSQNFRSTGKGGDISNCYTKPEVDTLLSAKANSAHTHVISDTTGLQNALNGKANSTHTHAISDIATLQSTLDNKADKIGASKRYYVGRLIDTKTYYKVFTISCADVQTVYAEFVVHGIEHAFEICGGVSLRYTSSTNADMYITIHSSVFSTSSCNLFYKKISNGEYEVYIKPNAWIGAVDCSIDNAVAIQNTTLENYVTWSGLNRISTVTGSTTDTTGMVLVNAETT